MFPKPENAKKRRGQGITHVSNLFQKYQKLLKPPQKSVIQAFVSTVQETQHITLKEEQCVYHTRSKTLALHLPGPMKSEILLHKTRILLEVGKRIGAEHAPKNIL